MAEQILDFSIAGVRIRIISDAEMKVTEAFQSFLISNEEKTMPQYVVRFQAAKELQIPKGTSIYEEGRFLIYSAGAHAYQRAFRRDTKERDIYAVSVYEAKKSRIDIRYLESERKLFTDTQKAFLHIGWEWVLMQEHKLMLHASCVNTEFGGIIFSGPSGVGKTTQAKLWCKYAEGVLINGDKTILAKQEDRWKGYGSPYAGSSGCYMNAECPVRAVLFLKQAKECVLRKLSVTEGFKKIYTGLTVNHWDATYVEYASTLALAMAMELPIYEFSCTPDLQAVEYLKEKLLAGEQFD